MSPPSEDAGALRRGRLHYLPVVPGKAEFAAEVRRVVLEERPRVVAVELPSWLEAAYRQAIARLPQITVIVYPDEKDEERAVYLPVEPCDPFTEAVRTALEVGSDVLFAEPDTGERPHLSDAYPDTYAVRRASRDRYVEAYRLFPQQRTEEIEAHAGGIAWKLQGADPLASVAVVVSLNLLDPVLDAMETPQEPPRRRRFPPPVDLLNPHPDCLAEITIEYPFFQEMYEQFRLEMDNADLIDRPRVQMTLLRESERAYRTNTGEDVTHWQRRLLAGYSRNLAMINSELAASLFDLTVAARSIVDDNFAWEVWETANRYPAQKAVSELETVNLSADEVWLRSRRMRLRRRLPGPKRRLRATGLKPRKKEKVRGEWARALKGNSICSYPPEDLTIEEYGRFLKQKAKSVISEERRRVEPFTTSLLDGIDVRETIRNWPRGEIYVRHSQKLAGEVGSVVVIFDEDRKDRYGWQTTWLGEHQNESDMAFYSTNPFDHMIGPGIGRAEYGGFLMTLPPRRLYDVWTDSDYELAESKAERLLLAGLDYSIQRHVVYVAAKPPRSVFRTISARMGRSILYVPIGQLSPTKLKKIRVVHVLDSYARRKDAGAYLW